MSISTVETLVRVELARRAAARAALRALPSDCAPSGRSANSDDAAQ
jgi:hypothetical protein